MEDQGIKPGVSHIADRGLNSLNNWIIPSLKVLASNLEQA